MLNDTDLSRADLNLLVLFETVMRERHVGRAAERLNLSASAVSHGLGRLRVLLNDPLFIKNPRGVTPSDRALELEPAIADILARVRGVVQTAAPFDPHTSTRSFTIAAPDGVSAVFLPALMAKLGRIAPRVDVRVRQLLPRQGETAPELAWRDAFAELDTRAMDFAVAPLDAAPPRFSIAPLFSEDFVIAARAGHAWLAKPTLTGFRDAQHLVVSSTGDPKGFVDAMLEDRGMVRRVALTAPNFMLALALLAETNLIAAVPRRFFELHGKRFKLASAKPPLPLPRFTLNMIAPKPALQDAGLAWLMEMLKDAAG
ncbi:LysR family transcriptional regulator [Vitreimonas flagellata]|uniref:LysR family transcriptional regulator n=1 Tax=Vitreimonas flagellata TaxID=2560861 RepID=UPI001074BD8E|nr:LysR family transcriptional regulator [Vitreimonas flagellata]